MAKGTFNIRAMVSANRVLPLPVGPISKILLQNCDYDIERAEQGIIYIDEIDKITRKSENPSITRDVSGEGVQQALLKLVEGTIASIPPQGGRKHPQQEMLRIDTSKILFICGGAFEFIGRLPVVAPLSELDEEALVRILTEPKNALCKQYQALLGLEDVKLEFTKEALIAMAKKALARKTGARGLRSIIEGILLDTMYDLPSLEGLEKVVVNESVINDNQSPELIYSNE